MPSITFLQPDGSARSVAAEAGLSVMRAAIAGSVPGIDAECGGALACATCHVYVDPAWLDRLSPPSGDEEDMLEAVAAPREAGSRLGCQIPVTPALDGLVVRVPDRQA